MTNIPSTEDRIWSVLSHLSALAFGIGILLPVVGWSDQRRKSKYASFQCLQALGYQSLGYTIWILLTLVVILALIFIMIPPILNADANGGDVDSVIGRWMIVIFIAMFGLMGLYVIFPMMAAIHSVLGRDYRYPILGNRLARYLDYDSTNEERLNEDHEDRWVAAMGHFSVIIAIWGMLAPLTTWMLQGKRSLFLKFQSIQTLVFQAGTFLLYFGAGFVYMIGFVSLIATTGLIGESGLGSPAGMFGFILFIAASLITIVIILLIPFLHILGQYAGYRVLKGDDYRYPLVGRLVEKWISKTTLKPPSPAAETTARL